MTTAVAIALLALISYLLRASGLLINEDNPIVDRYSGALTAGILASLIVSSTFSNATELTLDARAVGLIVAAIAAMRRLPLVVTLILAVAATATARLLT